MTFKEEIIKVLIDRIVIGLIVLAAVTYTTIQIEKSKADEAFTIAINQARIIKVAEVWEEAALFEEKFYDLYDAVEKEEIALMISGTKISKESVYNGKEVQVATKNLELARDRFISKIRANSFYLGPTLESQLLSYHRALAVVDIFQQTSLAESLKDEYTPELIESARSDVDKFRANIEQMRRYFIDGGQ